MKLDSGNTRHTREIRVLSVKNWARFQHYKKRNPPWVKLYTAILDDENFASLPDAAKGQLVSLWALAARRGNRIPFKVAYLRDTLNVTGKLYIEELIAAGWLIDASADASKDASPDASADASKSADKSATTEIETSSSLPITRFLASIPSDQRLHWSAVLDGWKQGLGFAGGRCAHPDDIDVGLTEYMADSVGQTFNPAHVRAYVLKAEKRRLDAEGTPNQGPYFTPEQIARGYE